MFARLIGGGKGRFKGFCNEGAFSLGGL